MRGNTFLNKWILEQEVRKSSFRPLVGKTLLKAFAAGIAADKVFASQIENRHIQHLHIRQKHL